jgi:hypothetical protein
MGGRSKVTGKRTVWHTLAPRRQVRASPCAPPKNSSGAISIGASTPNAPDCAPPQGAALSGPLSSAPWKAR